jgi:hypothetical protein
VRGVFIWSERQFLLDQAVLWGESAVPTKPLLPIDRFIFRQFLKEYMTYLDAPTQAAENAANANLAKRVPADILWLFRHSPQDTSAPFFLFVNASLNGTIKMGTDRYIDRKNAIESTPHIHTDSAKLQKHSRSQRGIESR